MPEDRITLYPSNWLYNAGVVWFLKVIEKACGESVVKNWIQTDGTVKIDIDIFKNTTIDNKETSIPMCMKYLIDCLVTDNDVNE